MSKIVALHQPNYIPWLGFFSKIKHADSFVILDNVDFDRRGITHRNKIRVPSGFTWLTIPVSKVTLGTSIQNIRLPESMEWQKLHWKTIERNYKKADYFYIYQDFFEKLYQEKFEYLWQLNERIIVFILKYLDINVEIIKTSNLNLKENLRKTDLIIKILEEVGGDVYLSGPSGKNYLDIEKFTQNNIELKFHEFEHPQYKQRYPGFEKNMA